MPYFAPAQHQDYDGSPAQRVNRIVGRLWIDSGWGLSWRSLGQHRLLGLQVFLQRVNRGRLCPHRLVSRLLHHLIIDKRFTDVPDLDVAGSCLPKLPFF